MDIKAALNDKSTLIFVLLALALVVSAVVGTLIYYFVNPAEEELPQYTTLVDRTKLPIKGESASMIVMPDEKKIEGKNTDKMSVSFWVFFDDLRTFASTTRHVLHMGKDPYGKMEPWDAGLYAHLGADGKFQVYLGSDSSNTYDGSSTVRSYDKGRKIDYMVATRGLIFPYMPEKRWVFVTVTQDRKAGKLTGYLDGEVVVTKTMATRVLDKNSSTGATIAPQTQSTCIACPGKATNLFLGADVGSAGNGGFQGLVSCVRLHSWDMNLTDVRKFYRMGPIDNLLSRLGLPAYTLRSPVFDRTSMRHDFGPVENKA